MTVRNNAGQQKKKDEIESRENAKRSVKQTIDIQSNDEELFLIERIAIRI